MNTLKDLSVKVASGLIVGLILTYLFHRDAFSAGVDRWDWSAIFKGILAVAAIIGWFQFMIWRSTKGIKNSLSDHFYTTDDAERLSAVQLGYRDEGITGYVYPADPQGNQVPNAGPVKLYRLFLRRD